MKLALIALLAVRACIPRPGSIEGVVTNGDTGAPFDGVTVVVDQQAAITDEHGEYAITWVMPGPHKVTFYVDTTAVEREIVVERGRASRLSLTLVVHPPEIDVGWSPEASHPATTP